MPVLVADNSVPNTLALRPVHRLLRARHLGYPRRARISPCSTPCSPGVAPGLLRVQHLTPLAESGLLRPPRLVLRLGHELLRARHLAFRLAPGLLRALDFPPCVDRRLLGAQHLALAPVTNYFVLDTWPSVQRPDCSVLSTSRPVLFADCSVSST